MEGAPRGSFRMKGNFTVARLGIGCLNMIKFTGS